LSALSNPRKANTSTTQARPNTPPLGIAGIAKFAGCMKNKPRIASESSGISLPSVNTSMVRTPGRAPRMFRNARPPYVDAITSARTTGSPKKGCITASVVAKKLITLAPASAPDPAYKSAPESAPM